MRSALERCSKSGFRPPDPHVSRRFTSQISTDITTLLLIAPRPFLALQQVRESARPRSTQHGIGVDARAQAHAQRGGAPSGRWCGRAEARAGRRRRRGGRAPRQPKLLRLEPNARACDAAAPRVCPQRTESAGGAPTSCREPPRPAESCSRSREPPPSGDNRCREPPHPAERVRGGPQDPVAHVLDGRPRRSCRRPWEDAQMVRARRWFARASGARASLQPCACLPSVLR